MRRLLHRSDPTRTPLAPSSDGAPSGSGTSSPRWALWLGLTAALAALGLLAVPSMLGGHVHLLTGDFHHHHHAFAGPHQHDDLPGGSTPNAPGEGDSDPSSGCGDSVLASSPTLSPPETGALTPAAAERYFGAVAGPTKPVVGWILVGSRSARAPPA
ncbi:MAG: hypothetical protein AAGN66_13535 [Acidobacteriota bacterium]